MAEGGTTKAVRYLVVLGSEWSMCPVSPENGMKLSGARCETSQRKHFLQAAHSEAVELVLQAAGNARGVDRFRKGHQSLLNVRLMIEPVLWAGSGMVLGEYCALLALLSPCGSASATSCSQLCLGNNFVLLQAKKVTVVSSAFPAFTVTAIK